MNVIFLDFNGVISNNNYEEYIFYPISYNNGKKWLLPISTSVILPLKALFQFAVINKVKIVLSTSWRELFSPKEIDKAFKDFLGIEEEKPIIFESTPIINEYIDYKRGKEIELFLEKCPSIENFLIIDDYNNFYPYQNDKLLLINSEIGFSFKDLEIVKKFFKV